MHKSVLLNEVLDTVNLKDKKIFIDGTLGLGGHSKKIFEKFPKIKIFGIDQDQNNIALAKKNLENFSDNLTIIKNNFENIDDICQEQNIKGDVDCVFLDIGVASTHFDEGERGFSFQNDGPLDMRMDKSVNKTARDVVNNYHEQDLFIIFKKYGEEPSARKIAKKICEKRKIETIKTSSELKDLIAEIINPKFINSTLKRVFQAIRIEVNDELGALEKGLEGACEVLGKGGRILVISYHSLEDRIVKKFFRNEEKACICPTIVPICICKKKQRLKIITKKPIVPTEEEIEENPRSRSAKMRIAEIL